MTTVTIHAAKTTLSQLLARVQAGEEIILARGKTPIAKLVPLTPPKPKRVAGAFHGQIHIGPEFFQPMTEAELAEWE